MGRTSSRFTVHFQQQLIKFGAQRYDLHANRWWQIHGAGRWNNGYWCNPWFVQLGSCRNVTAIMCSILLVSVIPSSSIQYCAASTILIHILSLLLISKILSSYSNIFILRTYFIFVFAWFVYKICRTYVQLKWYVEKKEVKVCFRELSQLWTNCCSNQDLDAADI